MLLSCAQVPKESKTKKCKEMWVLEGVFLKKNKINECMKHSGGPPERERVIN